MGQLIVTECWHGPEQAAIIAAAGMRPNSSVASVVVIGADAAGLE